MDEVEEQLPLHEEVARRLDLITEIPGAVLKYDANGDGMLDAGEWEMLRLLVEAEVARERSGVGEENDPWNIEEELEDPHVDLPILEVIDKRYEILREIGRGTQGKTLLARRRSDAHYVAVKELTFLELDAWKSLELFEREAEVLAKLDHPRIPRFVDSFSIDVEGSSTRFFLVQSFVSGSSLDVLLARRDRIGETQVLQFARDVLEVLAYLHSRNPPVIHRDIKPSNLIRQPDGRYCLVDFGGAQVVLPSDVGGSTIIGTTGYMPPEQLTGRAVPASDLYALGATMVHLVTHISPSDLPTSRLKLDWRDRAALTAPLADFVDRLVEPVVEDRFASADDALRHVDALEGKSTALIVPDGATTRSVEDVQKRKADFLVAKGATNIMRRKVRDGDVVRYNLSESAFAGFTVAGIVAFVLAIALALSQIYIVSLIAAAGGGGLLLAGKLKTKQAVRLFDDGRVEVDNGSPGVPAEGYFHDIRTTPAVVQLETDRGVHVIGKHLPPEVRQWFVNDLRTEVQVRHVDD